MATIKQLKEEISLLRAQLERQRREYNDDVLRARLNAYDNGRKDESVSAVIAKHPNGNYEVLTILDSRQTLNGQEIIVHP